MKTNSLEKHILGLICSVFDAYSAVLFMPDENGMSHHLAASFSLGENITDLSPVKPGNTLVGRIILTRQHLVVSNFDGQKDSLGYYPPHIEEEIKAFMGYPLPNGGVLCVDSKRQYSFSEKDVKILQLFAELISSQHSLLEPTSTSSLPRYFAELAVIQGLRFQFHRWPELLKNFLRAVSTASEFEYCAFATLQEGGNYYSLECESVPLLLGAGQVLNLPVANGLVGWVFRNEQAVYAEEGGLNAAAALFGKLPDMPDFPSVICVPVMVYKSCRGVLCLANTEPRPTDESLRNFIRMAIDHLSLFLENLYLKNRLNRLMPRATLERQDSRHPNFGNGPQNSDSDIRE